MCLVTTVEYAIAPVSALLGIIVGAMINGLSSRHALERQLTHEDARARAERFLDLRRDLYARIVSNYHQLGDSRRDKATIEAQLAAFPPLPDDLDRAVVDLEAKRDHDEAKKPANQHLPLMSGYDTNISTELALTKVSNGAGAGLSRASPTRWAARHTTSLTPMMALIGLSGALTWTNNARHFGGNLRNPAATLTQVGHHGTGKIRSVPLHAPGLYERKKRNRIVLTFCTVEVTTARDERQTSVCGLIGQGSLERCRIFLADSFLDPDDFKVQGGLPIRHECVAARLEFNKIIKNPVCSYLGVSQNDGHTGVARGGTR